MSRIPINLKHLDEDDQHQITVYTYRSVYNQLKGISTQTGIPVQNLLRSAINNFLDEVNK